MPKHPQIDHDFSNYRDLVADPARRRAAGLSCIYVRAWDGKVGGAIRSVDIAELELHSLIAWARSRGGKNPWAEQALALVLGHDPAEVQKLFGKELLSL